ARPQLLEIAVDACDERLRLLGGRPRLAPVGGLVAARRRAGGEQQNSQDPFVLSHGGDILRHPLPGSKRFPHQAPAAASGLFSTPYVDGSAPRIDRLPE